MQTTYPFNEEFVNGIVLQDSQRHTSDAIPRVELLNEIVGAEGSNPGSKRLHLQLNLQDHLCQAEFAFNNSMLTNTSKDKVRVSSARQLVLQSDFPTRRP